MNCQQICKFHAKKDLTEVKIFHKVLGVSFFNTLYMYVRTSARMLLKSTCCFFLVQRTDNFIVGLTDVSPNVTAPTLWNYDVCGRYPGAVPSGATVSLQCGCNVTAHRYVIVQFAMDNYLNFCELEIFIRRKCRL